MRGTLVLLSGDNSTHSIPASLSLTLFAVPSVSTIVFAQRDKPGNGAVKVRELLLLATLPRPRQCVTAKNSPNLTAKIQSLQANEKQHSTAVARGRHLHHSQLQGEVTCTY